MSKKKAGEDIKKFINRTYLTISLYAISVITVSALIITAVWRMDEIGSALGFVGAVSMPIIMGITIAYLLNALMNFIERKLLKRFYVKAKTNKQKKQLRAVSLTITIVITMAMFIGILYIIIPQLIQNVFVIFNNLPDYFKESRSFITSFFNDNPTLAEIIGDPIERLETLYTDWAKTLSPLLSGFVNDVSGTIIRILDALKNVLIGFVISIYLLFSKEMFIGQGKKMLFAFFKNETCQKIFVIYHKSNKIFLGSIIAKILDALIVGVICFIGCLLMGLDYALLISVIIFVFNLIPFFGPFIGSIPCILLLVLSDRPIQALWFSIFILILQNVDGNIINPRIMGDKTGLPAIWVLLSILIGGGFFGLAGMLLAVPVCAVLYMAIKTGIENRLKQKSLPSSTIKYQGNVEHFTEGYVYTEADRIADRQKYDLEKQQEKAQPGSLEKLVWKISNKGKK